MNSSKRKGDLAEREAAAMLTDLLRLDPPARRKLGAGRTTAAGGDTGDIEGVPDHAIQVANWADAAAAARQKPAEADAQAQALGVKHAATLVRLRGGRWVVVLTPAQWARYVHQLWQL